LNVGYVDTRAASQTGIENIIPPGIDFPRFVFQTDPYTCLTLAELVQLQQRLGAKGLYSRFRQRESEYKVNGPKFMNALGVEKMREVHRHLDHLHKKYEFLFSRSAKSAVENYEEQILFFESNLIRLILTIDRSEDSFGHSHLVSRYALLLNLALGIEDRSFAVQMERGAVLHDIGKIGVPRHILRKKEPLTPSERKAIQEHPFIGYELIEGFDFLKKSARIVLFHHEKYDGSGYPYGLKGNEIPLEARIFAIADALDAITSERHYSRRRSLTAALRQLEIGRGIHFDPDIVDAFLSVPLDYWRRLRLDSPLPGRSLTAH
jgi:HD-GYP domain-containing protein (c-di-GMP phosphodiesterase class II)